MKNAVKIALVALCVAQLYACDFLNKKDNPSTTIPTESITGENLRSDTLATTSVSGENQANTVSEEVK